MSLLARRELERFPSITSMFDTAFNDPFFTRNLPTALLEEGTLPIDLSEDDKNVIARASLPGFKKDDIEVEVRDGVLALNAKHTEEKEEKGEKPERFYRRERTTTSMNRRVALPTPVLEKEAQADLKDGVLTVRIPKTQKAPPQRVQVRQA